MKTNAPTSNAATLCLMGIVVVMPLMPVSGVLLPAKHLLFAGLALLGGLILWWQGRRGAILPALGTPTDIALGAWLAAAALSTVGAANPGMARMKLADQAALGLTYLLTLKTVRQPRDVKRLYAAMLLVAVVIALFGLTGYRRFVAGQAPESARAGYLSTPLFAHSYLAAQYLVLVFVGALVMLTERALSLRGRLLVTAALLPVGAFLFVTGSRGALLAVVGALLTSALVRARAATGGRRLTWVARAMARGLVWLLMVAGLILLASITGLLQHGAADDFLDRMLLVFDPAASELNFSRLRVWTHTLFMAADHVFAGVGLGSFGTVFPDYFPSARVAPHAHNQFLHVLAEMGALGLVTFLLLLRHARHATRRGALHLEGDPPRRAPFHAAVAALVAGLIYFLFETPLLWIEAGSVLMVLLAVMTRAGCDSRDAPASPAWSRAGLALGLAVSVVSLPMQWRYASAMWEGEQAAVEQQAARAAWSAGDRLAGDERAERALQLLASADELFPYATDFAANAAARAFEAQDPEQALAWHRLVDQRAPGTFEHLNAIGNLLMLLERPEQAIAPLRNAVNAHRARGSLPTYALLAQACLRAQRLEEAWYIYTDLVLLWGYHVVEPRMLLQAASTILLLRRNPGFAAALVNKYAELVPGAAEQEQVIDLRVRIKRQMSQPRRRLQRNKAGV